MKKRNRIEKKREKRAEYEENRRKKRARGKAHRWTLLVCAQNAIDSVRTVLCSHYVGEFDAQVHNKELSYEEVRALYNKGPETERPYLKPGSGFTCGMDVDPDSGELVQASSIKREQ